jgi:hypothetical protein
MKKQFVMATFFTLSCVLFCRAQSVYTQKEYENYPYWINMMKDSTANYFETEKAFTAYWSVRPIPTEEDDILGNPEGFRENESFFDKLITTKKEKREEQSQQYAFDYKAFKQWELRVAPWVHPDGSITTSSQRNSIWQQEMKKRNTN